MESTLTEMTHIIELLEQHCYETARRRCVAFGIDDPVIALLHVEALRRLGDPVTAMNYLEQVKPVDAEQHQHAAIARVELLHLQRGREAFIRSPEGKSGWDYEEYQLHYRDLALQALRDIQVDDLDERAAQRLNDIALRLGGDPLVAKKDTKKKDPAAALPDASGPHTLALQLIDSNGTPVVDAPVQLGIWQDDHFQPQIQLGAMHIPVPIPECRLWTARSDAQGQVDISHLPQGRLWLAIELDDECAPEGLRFLLHDILFPQQAQERLLIDIDAAQPDGQTSAQHIKHKNGWDFYNPTEYTYTEQAVHLDIPPGFSDVHELYWEDAPEQSLCYQIVDDQIVIMAAAPARSRRKLRMRQAADQAAVMGQTNDIMRVEETPEYIIVDTGVAAFRIPGNAASADAAPIDALRLPQKKWRACGRLELPADQQMQERTVEIRTQGALVTIISIHYQTQTSLRYGLQLTMHQGQPYVLVSETAQACVGARFHLDLSDFIGGRGFLAKGVEGEVPLWQDLCKKDQELARMQESVAWMAGTVGFGYGMCDADLDAADYVGVFTCRRGEWDDQDFSLIAKGPGAGRYEWDWPFPEMVGSTISMITASTSENGRCGYDFNWFNGTRHWGLMIGDFADNDGPDRQLWQVQQQCSSARLQDLITWELGRDVRNEHPRLLCQRADLPALRRKSSDAAYAEQWQGLCNEAKHKKRSSAELRAVLERDAYLIWQRKIQLERHLPIRVHMSLLGRQWGDMYSPVGGRDITDHAEHFDLVAACCAFAPEQEREARRNLLIIGQRFMDPDFMNWQYGGRNANFEADRVDIVGSIGLCLRGHPLADAMIEHVIERMDSALDAYCTPGSGKWYENPACYYVHAMTCRLHIATLLQRHDLWRVEQTPLLNDLLRWAAVLATPAYPQDHDFMRDGCSLDEFRQQPKGRWIPPIGDHAGIGREIPECHVAMAPAFDHSDPELAATLRWLYQAGSKSNGGGHSQYHLLFTGDDPELLIPQDQAALTSRRLEGFGAVMRHRFEEDADEEGYVLFKQGPGGYRYHRSEGSLIYFEHGVPILFDGGEAGETWRHTTLSRGETHMPLAAGHIERWHSAPSMDFAQGVHPLFIEAGEAVFLSDNCHHELVAEAERRFFEPNPVDHRSCCYVKGDYLLVHDALHLPTDNKEPIYMHMQTVADDCRLSGDGDWRFKGRFGVDVQVLMPDQEYVDYADERMAHLYYRKEAADSFAMQHLQVRLEQPRGCLSVVRALAPGAEPLRAQLLNNDVREPLVTISGNGIHDLHLLALASQSGSLGAMQYQARYFSILLRADRVELHLQDAEFLRCEDFAVHSLDGEPVLCQIDRQTGAYTISASDARVEGLDLRVQGEVHGHVGVEVMRSITALCNAVGGDA